MNATFVDGLPTYTMKLRRSASGFAVTIPVDVWRTLNWDAGDVLRMVFLEDGVLVTKPEQEPGR